ncbi:MFS transporter [Bradyrhizobium sp. U87765 SZCCT0131]|uniref:MFS transporter n=1 Tax=unclassified Bradyrhizobium TaxID=2631580 RepID=UPI001BA5F35C|nr:MULTISPECIES: MFS transporter [unclassified Bradyrhizobium]MBR1216868.1 MFS transporter [Bradyrhizobium sp. U87765 SZCCT0131]MBR1259376.1 MFS transporter [Bradyrhizobium sp. U87765 SZCCT0134]MBR1305517.1 MFS transporter [Bradyrhizobium sp. U87765 SZCCT0110]MBR1321884.1 MFS transporter [Bradyrhizobium sp. U87765 SZCCT0109]MBR1350838.1 MFS transporter [Bradyrhizobium sp. U87765 SZCCT0048]
MDLDGNGTLERAVAADAAYAGISKAVAPSVSAPVAWLLALAAGLAVANAYYAQPLIDVIADTFGLGHAVAGSIITLTQVGYAAGLVLVVPLGDLFDRRRLIIGQLVVLAAALLLVAFAGNAGVLLAGLAAVGMLTVVTQQLVAHAASLARPSERGRIVGIVTSGIITGILVARTVSGTLSDLLGWRSVYIVSAVAILLIALLLAATLPAQARPRVRVPYGRLIVSVFTLFAQEKVLRVRGALALLIFAAVTALWTPMVLPLSAPPLSLSHTQVGLFGLAGALGALGAAAAGRLADRGHAERTTGIALALMLLSWWPVALLHVSLWPLVIGIVVIDFGLQAVHVSNQSLIYQVRPDAQSRLAAAYMLCYCAGCGGGSLASTLVYDRFGWSGVCLLGAVFSALALLVWAVARPRPAPAR